MRLDECARRILVVLALAGLMVLIIGSCAGCRFSLLGGPAEPGPPGPSATTPPAAAAHAEGELGPFPWGWALGITAVGALAAGAAVVKAPALVDEVIVATAGGVAFIVALEMVRELWHAKWMILILAAVTMLLLAAWKLARRYWSPSGPSPSSSPMSEPAGDGAQ